jgi:hypothetical protein
VLVLRRHEARPRACGVPGNAKQRNVVLAM